MAIFYPAPSTPAEFTSNFILARQIVGRRLGLKITDGTAAEIRELAPADAVRFTDELALFVVDRPAYFSPQTLAIARERISSPGFGAPMADTSTSAALSQFGDEFIANAEAMATAFPRVLVGLLFAAVVVYVAAKTLPDSIAKARAS